MACVSAVTGIVKEDPKESESEERRGEKGGREGGEGFKGEKEGGRRRELEGKVNRGAGA